MILDDAMTFDTTQVYEPAEDTFLLIRAALAEVKSTDTVIEIGVGSGAVSAAVQNVSPRTIGVDINPHAVAFARKNNHVETIRTDLFSGIQKKFDLILFNAPYLPTSPEERIDDWLEYALDGGVTGREVIERFLPDAVAHLSESGRILLLISSLTGLLETTELCKREGCVAECVAEEAVDDGEILYVVKIWRD